MQNGCHGNAGILSLGFKYSVRDGRIEYDLLGKLQFATHEAAILVMM